MRVNNPVLGVNYSLLGNFLVSRKKKIDVDEEKRLSKRERSRECPAEIELIFLMSLIFLVL